ncbi:hypothetical protein ABIB25_000947 [Nakamurella sp. UYEF19]|uniref:hypothetical protein n=1 Tax=Nakamurella sp. UYEF19 TaxID=1756392 RepID=UPI0033929F05
MMARKKADVAAQLDFLGEEPSYAPPPPPSPIAAEPLVREVSGAGPAAPGPPESDAPRPVKRFRWGGRHADTPEVQVPGVQYPSRQEIERLYERAGTQLPPSPAETAWGQVLAEGDLFAALVPAPAAPLTPPGPDEAGWNPFVRYGPPFTGDPITAPIPVLVKTTEAQQLRAGAPEAHDLAPTSDTAPATTTESDRQVPEPPASSPVAAGAAAVYPWSSPAEAGWGGVPVEMSAWHQRLSQTRPAVPVAAVRLPGAPACPVGDLLALRGLARRKAATQLMSAGLPAGARRKVLVGSVFAGVGVSTVTALIHQVWADRRVPALLLDGNRQRSPGLAARLGDRITRRPWESDVAALAVQIGQSWNAPSAGSGGVLVDVGPGTTPVPSESDIGILGGAAGFAPLVLVDGGSGDESMLAQAEQIRPDLLVLVCRLSAEELRTTADFLREVARGGAMNCRRNAVVVAVGADSRRTRQVKAALAAVADVSAAVVPLGWTSGLVARSAPVRPGDGGSAALALAAAVVVAT